MSTIFSKIVKGEIPSYKIAETGECLAFLDVFPLVKGHTLVIPKKEVDYIFDVEDPLYSSMWLFAKKVSRAIRKEIPCSRVGVTVIGLEVAHAHIHLIPVNSVGDINFARPKLQPAKEEMEQIASRIRNAYTLL